MEVDRDGRQHDDYEAGRDAAHDYTVQPRDCRRCQYEQRRLEQRLDAYGWERYADGYRDDRGRLDTPRTDDDDLHAHDP